MKKWPILIIIPLLLTMWLQGCGPAPRQGQCELDIKVTWAKKDLSARGPEDIATVTAILSRQKLIVTEALQVDQASCSASGSMGGLYAGMWNLAVHADDAEGRAIYAGETEVLIVEGERAQAEMTLGPAPGSLELSLNVAPLSAAGLPAESGKVYVYLNPTTNQSSSFDLTREGDYLRGLIEKLPSMTYEARVAVPQISEPVFVSEYFSFTILPGRTTLVEITATGGVEVAIGIEDQPGQVTGVNAAVAGGSVFLSWHGAAGATGYRIYRSDGDGRLRHLALVEGGDVTTYTDDAFDQAKAYGGAVRYAVAALTGTIEGIRSDPVAVEKG